MNKQILQNMCALSATPKMLQMAAADVPKITKYRGWKNIVYENGLYLRCLIANDILKVAVFLPDYMRTGSCEATYELFISRVDDQFLTFDRVGNRWLTAKLDTISLPNYVCYSKGTWISAADNEIMKTYLGVEADGYAGLLNYQRQVRANELTKRHNAETDPWDADLAQTPTLPKDWERWVSKVGISENYIYYHYSKKGADVGYCTFCEKEVPIKQPRHNANGRCPCCGHSIVFKSAGKAGTVITKRCHMYLLQRCRDGFMVREFMGYRKYPQGNYRVPECACWETRRVIYGKGGKNPRAYYKGLYRQCNTRWIKCPPCSPTWRGDAQGRVYGKTLPSLAKKELHATGLPEMICGTKTIDPEVYLAVLEKVPQLEQIVKAGLPRLAKECMSPYNSFCEYLRDNAESSLIKMLGINTQELKRLRKNNGGKQFLSWLQYEKASGSLISDSVISWFCKENIEVDDLAFIRDKMSMMQISNYVRRQMTESHMNSKEVLTTWSDYLSMAKRLGIDIEDEIIYRVCKLQDRHDALVKRCHSKSLAIQAGEILSKYPHVEEICRSLGEKYEYTNNDYAIQAPTQIEDVLLEGQSLSHCVASSERYWERIEHHETYILFLRRAAALEQPYYTLEIEPDGTVRQKRTKFDRQEADIEDATKFLMEWQKVIAKRLSDEDKRLAQESRVLRAQEYAQLRRDQVIIRTGELAGSLLVDVLLADLMESAS